MCDEPPSPGLPIPDIYTQTCALTDVPYSVELDDIRVALVGDHGQSSVLTVSIYANYVVVLDIVDVPPHAGSEFVHHLFFAAKTIRVVDLAVSYVPLEPVRRPACQLPNARETVCFLLLDI